jgi:hypothetical protein
MNYCEQHPSDSDSDYSECDDESIDMNMFCDSPPISDEEIEQVKECFNI